MPGDEPSSDAPPSYAQATGSSTASTRLQVPNARNNIPVHHRRSMEDENRPLPLGWVRQFDAQHEHQFFVDTTKDPPRSVWHHPYDDQQYLSTLSSEERERIQALSKTPSKRDTETMSTDGSVHEDVGDSKQDAYPRLDKPSEAHASSSTAEGSSSQAAEQQQKPKLGRRLKDKLTGSTHEQRVAEREQRAREEEAQYEQYLHMRGAMKRAYQTGEPQFLGKDREGRDIYVEPPGGPDFAGQHRGNVYVNPYNQGPYANPNARFIRPADPYYRPYGGGYGGGFGLPLAVGGGLAGGLLLGGALGGFGA